MKKVIFVLAIAIIGLAAYDIQQSARIANLEKLQITQLEYIQAIEAKMNALEYKQAAQIYVLCNNPSKEALEQLSASCEETRERYKQSK